MKIFYCQQAIASDDCITRSRGKTKYLALTEFDEVLVTFENQSLLSILDSISEKDPNAGLFTFFNTNAFLPVKLFDLKIRAFSMLVKFFACTFSHLSIPSRKRHIQHKLILAISTK